MSAEDDFDDIFGDTLGTTVDTAAPAAATPHLADDFDDIFGDDSSSALATAAAAADSSETTLGGEAPAIPAAADDTVSTAAAAAAAPAADRERERETTTAAAPPLPSSQASDEQGTAAGAVREQQQPTAGAVGQTKKQSASKKKGARNAAAASTGESQPTNAAAGATAGEDTAVKQNSSLNTAADTAAAAATTADAAAQEWSGLDSTEQSSFLAWLDESPKPAAAATDPSAAAMTSSDAADSGATDTVSTAAAAAAAAVSDVAAGAGSAGSSGEQGPQSSTRKAAAAGKSRSNAAPTANRQQPATTKEESTQDGESHTLETNKEVPLMPLPLPRLSPLEQLTEIITGRNGKSNGSNSGGSGIDVEHVRSLCAKLGTALPSELRPQLWGILLGRGLEVKDKEFVDWVEKGGMSTRKSLTLRSSTPEITGSAPEVTGDNMSDKDIALEADATALATSVEGSDVAAAAALAADIVNVVAFYCERRQVAYEPVLSALAAPLLSLKRGASTASAMLYPLISGYTLFIDRGLSEGAKPVAVTLAHKQFHFLCTYHAPLLTQHLDRCYPGWELPRQSSAGSGIIGAAVEDALKRDSEASALVDDLGSRTRPSVTSATTSATDVSSSSSPFVTEETEEEDSKSEPGSEPGSEAAAEMTLNRHKGRGEHSNDRSSGLVPPNILGDMCSAFVSNAAVGSATAMLPVWDYFLIRHDKHFGFFLLLALLLREESTLMKLQGRKLRDHLEKVLKGTLLTSTTTSTTTVTNSSSSEAPAALHVSALDEGAALQWCCAAETLDLATPESFRHQLSLIGEAAQGEHLKTMLKMNAAAAAAAAAAAEKAQSAETAAVGVEIVSSSPVKDASAAAAAEPSRKPSLNVNKMMSMMADAGAMLTAGVDTLKLPQQQQQQQQQNAPLLRRQSSAASADSGSSSSGVSDSSKMELLLPQLCLSITPQEMISSIGRKEGKGAIDTTENNDIDTSDGSTDSKKRAKQQLHRVRKPLPYFAVDCRPTDQVRKGRFPTAYHLDPAAIEDPDQIVKLLEVFQPLVGKAHICLLGAGHAYLLSKQQQLQQDNLGDSGTSKKPKRASNIFSSSSNDSSSSSSSSSAVTLKAARDDYSYVNTVALFFMKRGFSYVSVVQGGYAGAHEALATSYNTAVGLNTLVDHAAQDCALCSDDAMQQGSGSAANPIGTGFKLTAPNIFKRVSVKGGGGNIFNNLNLKNSNSNSNAGNSDTAADGVYSRSGSMSSTAAAATDSNAGDSTAGPTAGSTSGSKSGSALSKAFADAFSFNKDKNKDKEKDTGTADTNSSGNNSSTATASNNSSDSGPATGSTSSGAGESTEKKSPMTNFFTRTLRRASQNSDTTTGNNSSSSDAKNAGTTAVAASAQAANSTSNNSNSSGNTGGFFSKLTKPVLNTNNTNTNSSSGTNSSSSGNSSGVRQKRVSFDASSSSSGAGGGGTGGMFVISDGEGSESDFDDDVADRDNPNDTGGKRGSFLGGTPRSPVSKGAAVVLHTDAEKAVALLEHQLSGMTKGSVLDLQEYSRVNGASVYTALKRKEKPTQAVPTASSDVANDVASKESDVSSDVSTTAVDNTTSATAAAAIAAATWREIPRKLFLTRERILVLAEASTATTDDNNSSSSSSSSGSAVCTVKSNHHLTELAKVTFMRKDPSLITLHYRAAAAAASDSNSNNNSDSSSSGGDTKKRVYRLETVAKKEEFVTVLQASLKRFS